MYGMGMCVSVSWPVWNATGGRVYHYVSLVAWICVAVLVSCLHQDVGNLVYSLSSKGSVIMSWPLWEVSGSTSDPANNWRQGRLSSLTALIGYSQQHGWFLAEEGCLA